MVSNAVPSNASARHAALSRAIDAHNYRYYVLDDPSVTDAEFDALLGELKSLEATHSELVTPDSPTQRVAGEVRSGAVKVKHGVRMSSLDNAYSTEDVAEFFRRVRDGLSDRETLEFVIEPKLDGASIEVVYENRRIVVASTRGDGETGEDITANVRTIRGIPLTIAYAGRLTLRGEVVIYKRDLESFNAERVSQDLEPFANPRNAAAGSLRMMDASEVARRPLRALFYQLVEGADLHASHVESLAWLASLGLPTHRREVKGDEPFVLTAIDAIDAARASYPFETDGAVVKVNAYRQQDILGFTSKFPKWAVAFKFKAERIATRIREITVQVGRTGALTPVANLDPVSLAGTTVSRASLHNGDQIAELDVRLGDRVYIEKAGEIIPQIVGVDMEARTGEERLFAMPHMCPSCGTEVFARKRDEARPELGDEVVLRCPNRSCPAQVKGQIFYFARRFAMDIDHLGAVLVEQLVDRKLVLDVADLYTLTTAQIVAIERMADKSAQNVIESIARSKTRSLDRLLCGLGIPQVGQVAARQLAEVAHTLPQLLAWTEDETRAHVGSIRGFGPKMVESVVLFLFDKGQRSLMEKLAELGVSAPQPRAEVATSGPLLGVRVCVTGVLSRKREDVNADIRAAGGEIHDSVKKDTTYLVAGEKTGKSKLDQAKKYGTKVIGETDLMGLLEGKNSP
jgi:DNA ligase (NAD+)